MNASIVVSAGIVVVIATIIVLIAGRRDEDRERQRTFTRYVDAVCLLSVFVLLFASYSTVAQLSRFIIGESHRFGFSPGLLDQAETSFSGRMSNLYTSGNDAIWRSAVQAALVALAAGIVLVFHRRQRRAMKAWEGFDGSSGARVDLAFRYAVCFVAVFVILMALSFGLYGIFRIAAPGVASGSGGSAERERGIAQAVSLLALGAGAFLVFRTHWTDTMAWSRPGPTTEPARADVSE